MSNRFASFLAVIVLIAAVYACAAYANLAFAVTDASDYRFFPPFAAGVNHNRNDEQKGEYFNIARALASGQGFAHPFSQPTGPTAWVPPIFPALLAVLMWMCDGDADALMMILVFLQVNLLIATGLLVFALVRQTSTSLGPVSIVLLFVVLLLGSFRAWFQSNNEAWLSLLAIDLLIAGYCWCQPLRNGKLAVAWGLFGGVCALINPMIALAWGVLSLMAAFQKRSWAPVAIALLFAWLTMLPWTVRNYVVFNRVMLAGRSNLAFELYQSQCLLPNGLLGSPSGVWIRETERAQFKALGEMAYLDRTRELFWRSVGADPLGFLERIGRRFLAATLWYEPLRPVEEARRPWGLWINRLLHSLPFLALLVLAGSSLWRPLSASQWTVIGIYVLYLGPYIVISYVDRYAAPLLGVNILLVLWAVDRLFSWLYVHRGESANSCFTSS